MEVLGAKKRNRRFEGFRFIRGEFHETMLLHDIRTSFVFDENLFVVVIRFFFFNWLQLHFADIPKALQHFQSAHAGAADSGVGERTAAGA